MRSLRLLPLFPLALAAQLPPPARVLTLQSQTAHVQGIDTDGASLWVTAVDRVLRKGYLQIYSVEAGRLEKTVELQDGDRFHPGGIAADGASVWIPVAEYKAQSSAWIQQRNRRTLELEFQFPVADHIGCVAVTPEYIIGGNWDSRDFYVWDHKGKLLRKVASDTGNAYQDVKIRDGLVVASGVLADRKGAVDWLDPVTFRLLRRVPVGNTDKGEPLTREGMTLFRGQLWFLPEDGVSRLFTFDLPAIRKDR